MADGLYYVTLPYACGGVIVRAGAVVDGAPIFGWAWSKDTSLTKFHFWVLGKGGNAVWVGEVPESG